jgi:hypothetical protein
VGKLGHARIFRRIGIDPAPFGALAFPPLVRARGDRIQMEGIYAVAALACPMVKLETRAVAADQQAPRHAVGVPLGNVRALRDKGPVAAVIGRPAP